MYREKVKRKSTKGLYVVVTTTMLAIFVMFILSLANTGVPDATTSETKTVTVKMDTSLSQLPENTISSNVITITEEISPDLPLTHEQLILEHMQEQERRQQEQEQEQQQSREEDQSREQEQEPPPMIEALSGRYSMEHYEFGRSVFTFKGNRVSHTFERGDTSITKTGRYELLTGYELDWANGEIVNGKNFPVIVPSTAGAENGLIVVEFHWNNGTIEYAEFDRFGFIAPEEAIWWRAYPHFKTG